MSFFQAIGRSIERNFKELGPRIKDSFEKGFKKPPPEVMHNIGEAVQVAGFAFAAVFPPAALIGMVSGTVGPKVGHAVQRLFKDMGRQAKKLEEETKKLGDKLREIRELHARDVSVFERTKQAFDKMRGMIDKAQHKLRKVGDDMKQGVERLTERVAYNQMMVALIKRRIGLLQELKADIRKECEETQDIDAKKAANEWEAEVDRQIAAAQREEAHAVEVNG